jgi:aminopeptidase YwaD
MSSYLNIRKIFILLALIYFPGVIVPQINKNELYKTIQYLASKELAGRMAGSKGYSKAAAFIAGEFNKLNLKPAGDDKYFQKLKVEYNEILAPEHFSVIMNGKTVQYKLGSDYVYRGFTGAGKLTAPVVFCGYGIDQPELGYNDYNDVDVKDKVVMVFRYNPIWKLNGKPLLNDNPREKAIVAAIHGAIGILFVSFPNDPDPQKPIGSVINGKGEQMLNFPEIHIGLNVASDLFNGTSHTLNELQTLIDSTKKPFPLSLNNQVNLEVHTKYQKEREVVNVIGIIEGTDPVLKDSFLVLGAHLDHVGSQAGKIFFPGANDNASGCAALLQIARTFAQSKDKPKCSIAFVFFASEEQGLNGSKYFVSHLPPLIHHVQYMFNFDCIGYGDSIQVYGGKSFPVLWNIVKEIDNKNDKLLVAETGEGGGADADPFFRKGIKTLYFVSTNSYKHLHQITDTPETINKDLLAAIAKLGYKTAQYITTAGNIPQ